MIVSRLEEIRRSAGLSQERLADRLRVSRVQVSRIENSISRTPVETLESWADACGYDLVLVARESPAARELAAELDHATPAERALCLRLSRLLPRLDDRERQMVVSYVRVLEEDADAREGVTGRRAKAGG